jgi:hypothetical protein
MGVLFMLGVVVLLGVHEFLELYCYASCLLFFISFIGGLLHYNSPELRDWRDIYREKNRLQLEKIKQLNLLISGKK